MAMQVKAWMMKFLFSTQISNFLESMRCMDGIFPSSKRLLICDDHNNHVTLKVAKVAKEAELDLANLPSYTSYAFQPLDVTILKPFKTYFKEYRNYQTSKNVGQKAIKETLAHWVSLALGKALNKNNIEKDFNKTGIYLLNRTVVDKQLAPLESFWNGRDSVHDTLPEGSRHVEELQPPSRLVQDVAPKLEADTVDWDPEPVDDENEYVDNEEEAFGIVADARGRWSQVTISASNL